MIDLMPRDCWFRLSKNVAIYCEESGHITAARRVSRHISDQNVIDLIRKATGDKAVVHVGAWDTHDDGSQDAAVTFAPKGGEA